MGLEVSLKTRQVPVASPDVILEARAKSGARWFLWIAGLSLVNSIASFAGAKFHFVLGLGITQVFDGVAKRSAGAGNFVALLLDAFVAGIFILFGLLAIKGRDWAFILGIILYALDGFLFLLVKDIVGIGFHLFAIFFIYRGLKASEALAKLKTLAYAPVE